MASCASSRACPSCGPLMGRNTPRRRSVLRRPSKRLPDTATPKSPVPEGPSERPERTTFPVVGIGASAGGLEAFSQLLRELSTDTGMAFVLIQHLDPKHESQLSEVLSRTTAMPVITVTDRLRVEPNHIYVIPPNAEMTIGDGALALTSRATVDRHMPIDHFFRSLAQELEGRAIGVVLSGTGSDGTVGLRVIKAEGGITFVQDEQSAKHGGMPQSARAIADFVLPPAAIARELGRIGGHPYVNPVRPSAAGPGQPEDEANVGAVLRVLRTATGVDFAQYKPASVRRRIARRMLLKKIDDLATYVRNLRQTPDEARALRDEILIQVTGFFRDPEGFTALRRSVFPSLVKGRAEDEPIRIWVPGCATGEEAYSIVICLMEYLGEQGRTLPIQMFATDLSAAAVTQARGGRFPTSIENEVSADRLRQFFIKTDGRYQISKAIRDACVFAQQDLTRDPPFSKLDLISCSNVLIYLSAALQERVIPVLHYALKPTGFLKLGSSESVGRSTNLFSVLDKKHKIYARKPGPSARLGFGVSGGDRVAAPARAEEREAGWSAAASETADDRLILFFEERARGTATAAARQHTPGATKAGEHRVAQLTRELAEVHQHLQAISEEHEARIEELRAATEEVQSSNEELQSTNEELETAKEELQATNEELTTVNDELNSRNVELSQISDDLANLLTSTHVPIIMVSLDLRVRRLTPVTERVLTVAPGDVGRPISDLRLSVEVPGLEALLREVIETLTVQEREMQGRDSRWYSVRVRPYRTADNKIDGAVISFVDIDALKRGLDQTKQARDP